MALRTDYESEEQRAAFRLYLELRSLQPVWDQMSKGEATIKRWSTWFKWVPRADAISRGEPDPGPPPKEVGAPSPRKKDDQERAEELKRRRREVPRVQGPDIPLPDGAEVASPPAPDPAAAADAPAEMPLQEARRVVRKGIDAGLGSTRAPEQSQEIRAVRTLWITAVKTLLAGQCSTVRGSCPFCGGRVELQGCGQAPNFKPSAADVKSLMTLMREVEAEERAKEQEAAADRRTVDEVAHSIAVNLEQLGGLELLAALVEHMTPAEA